MTCSCGAAQRLPARSYCHLAISRILRQKVPSFAGLLALTSAGNFIRLATPRAGGSTGVSLRDLAVQEAAISNSGQERSCLGEASGWQ